MKSGAARWSTGGWKIIVVAIPFLIAVALTIVGSMGVSRDPVLTAVRASAIAGFLTLVAPFTASAALTLYPSALTRYVRGRRRYFGIVFPFAMLIHIACVGWLFQINPDQPVNPAMFVLGVFGYLSFSHSS